MISTEYFSDNHEMRLIFEIAQEIHRKDTGASMFSKPDAAQCSYFVAPDIPNRFDQNIFDFDFTTPVQLKAALEKMWAQQACDTMRQFSAAVTVATFKNREAQNAIKTGIPSYVYAF